MSTYAPITELLSDFEQSPSPDPSRLYQQFLQACQNQPVLDPNYAFTLDRHGITRLFQLNAESLSLDAAVAVLTALHHAERAMPSSSGPSPLLRAFETGYAQRLLRRIAELEGTYARPSVVTFFHEYERDGYLSNWFAAPFTFAAHTFPTGEHWMMWQKARVFGDGVIEDKILQVPATNPGKVKWLGKQVADYNDDRWDAVDQQLMRMGLRQKFLQNERLLNDLLSTGSAALGEASPTDKKWGVGFGIDHPKLANPANWYGRNLLGITLMEVRSDLRRLSAMGGEPAWDKDDLRNSHAWHMSLLELSRVKSARPVVLMYATIMAIAIPSLDDAHGVLRQIPASIGEIDEDVREYEGAGLPEVGWHELVDELALQVRLGVL